MNSFASEFREEMVTSLPSAPPARHSRSVPSYLLAALRPAPPKSKERGAPSPALARIRRMRRSARALSWWIPFWYVIGQLVLVLWMDESWQLNQVQIENDKWKQLHVRMAEAPDRPLVLMLGSSRTDWAFQAGRLSGQPGPDGRPLLVYNFGVPTNGPLHQALYVNDLLDEGVRPRLLLVEFVTAHFNDSRRGILSEEHFTECHWLNAHQLLFFHPYFNNPRHALTYWLEARLAPWYGYRWSVHEHLQGHHSVRDPYDPVWKPMDRWGWRILGKDFGTPAYRAWRWAYAARWYGESLRRFRLGKKPAQALRDLLTRCRREHLAVALVLMPTTKEFDALYNPEGRAALAHFFAELRQDYGVEVIDATDWLDKEDFDDGHHVLTAGAEKFTARMIGEVQKVLARTKPPEQESSTR
jgi:hypothetical protein